MVLWLVPIFMILYYVGFVNDVPGISSPLHASCKIKWNWPNNKCLEINQRMVDQIVKWTPEDICNGTQKCLYSLKEQNQNFIKVNLSCLILLLRTYHKFPRKLVYLNLYT